MMAYFYASNTTLENKTGYLQFIISGWKIASKIKIIIFTQTW